MLRTTLYCFFVSVELPEPEPELPLELPEPMLPLLGEVVVLLGDVVELLPPVPPEAPEPDLLKCASHSEREIWPSLFASTDEKLGAALLEPLAPALLDGLLLDGLLLDGVLLEPDAALPPEDDVPDDPLDMPEPPELEPDAAGDDEDLSLLVLLEELCASATLDRANNAAAVAALITLRFNIG